MTRTTIRTTTDTSRYPTPEELYAFELEARRLRARALGEAFGRAALAVKSLLSRAVSALGAKVVRHA